MFELETPTLDDLEAIGELDARNFGASPLKPDHLEALSHWLDMDRSLVVRDAGRAVAFAASVPFELTLPGLNTVRMSGVTWVSVAPSHTRQGILGQLMHGLDQLAIDHGESVLGLQASTGGIYERFGYGPATRCRIIELDRRAARIASSYNVDRRQVTLYSKAERIERSAEQLDRFDRYRRATIGELSINAAYLKIGDVRSPDEQIYAEHPDGYAIYTISPRWNEGHPAHEISIDSMVWNTPQAHLDLWAAIMASDLVGPIRSRIAIGPDDPLPYFLADPRTLRTVELNDFLWLKVNDPKTAFAARTYRGDASLTIMVEGSDEVLRISPQGVETVSGPADMLADRSALGPLLLGSTSATVLGTGRRVHGSRQTLATADLLFGHGDAVHSQTYI